MATEYKVFDGLKAIRLQDFPPEAWTTLVGQDADSEMIQKLYKAVPWMFRGPEIRANLLAAMPFQILNAAGDEVDNSEDYQNVVGWLPDPFRLLWLTEAALALVGRSYLFKHPSLIPTTPFNVRYMRFDAIRPKITKEDGLIGFERVLPNRRLEKIPVEDIVWFWEPDPFVEIGPPEKSSGEAALSAAGALFNLAEFIAAFFGRGAIKVTVLGVEGGKADERQRLKSWWRRITGIGNAFGTEVFNTGAITPTVIGEGIKELENTALTKEQRQDISTAFGIPDSLLFSDASTFATAKQDKKNAYEDTVIPQSKLIEQQLNLLLFGPAGFFIKFNPQALDVLQADEAMRTDALLNLVNAGVEISVAMKILGYDLPIGVTFDEVSAHAAETAAARAAARVNAFGQSSQGSDRPNPRDDEPDQSTARAMMGGDLRKWQRKSIKALGKTKAAGVPFESEHIPAALAAGISGGLSRAKTPARIKQIFTDAQSWSDYP